VLPTNLFLIASSDFSTLKNRLFALNSDISREVRKEVVEAPLEGSKIMMSAISSYEKQLTSIMLNNNFTIVDLFHALAIQ